MWATIVDTPSSQPIDSSVRDKDPLERHLQKRQRERLTRYGDGGSKNTSNITLSTFNLGNVISLKDSADYPSENS